MASTTLLCKLLFTLIVACVSAQKATNSLRCYVCESETYSQACENSADVATIASADCSTLIYDSPREENERSIIDETLHSGRDGKFRGKPLIDEMFQRKGDARSASSFRYACLKVSLTSGDKKGTSRTCAKVPSSIKDTCEFIKNGANPQVEVISCDACEMDNCNSASLSEFSILLTVFSVVLVLLKR